MHDILMEARKIAGEISSIREGSTFSQKELSIVGVKEQCFGRLKVCSMNSSMTGNQARYFWVK